MNKTSNTTIKRFFERRTHFEIFNKEKMNNAEESESLTYILRPSPFERTLDYGATNDWAYHGPTDNGKCIAHNGSAPLRWMP